MSVSKIVAAAASSAGGGAGLDVDEVFSTYLYDGTGSAQTITNGIDLSGEGGLVWIKNRDAGNAHKLTDTERGVTKTLISSSTALEATEAQTVTAFNSTGFTLGTDESVNRSGKKTVSWTWRKAPKFFNIVTYTGNTVGSSAQTISHGLGSTPGFIIVKRYSINGDWVVWHRYNANGTGFLNLTDAFYTTISSSFISSVGSTSFTVGESANTNGQSFVAYIFAHNDGDGEFGPDSDQDIIKCDTFTNSGSTVSVNLGFEPQLVMFKRVDNTGGSWFVADSMRGMVVGGTDRYMTWDGTSDEANLDAWEPTPTGFDIKGAVLGSGDYIYMAIRRGPLAAPEDATDVFDVKQATSGNPSTVFNTGFDVDMNINTEATSGSARYNFARLIGVNYLNTDGTAAENGGPSTVLNSLSNVIDLSSGWWGPQSGVISYSWRRAPSFFDVCAYTGAGAAQTVNHNLGVVPEMMWIKNRDSAENWAVYHSALGTSKYLHLNTTDAALTTDAANRWNNTSPTATQFTVGTSTEVSHFTRGFIAYLFATVAGVSKVGSFTSTGSDMTIDCGFSNGARFVLLKKTNATDQWYLWDSVRGIVSGNDSRLKLNDATAAVSHSDNIDPDNSGFILHDNILGGSGNTFIFYAIA